TSTSLSSFDDIYLLVSSLNWAPLTVFLNFLLTTTNSDPSHLLFYIFVEDLVHLRKTDKNELVRWIFEIHSTFTMNGSPLYINLPQQQIDSLNRYFENSETFREEDIKTLFNDAKEYVKNYITQNQLTEFNHKRTLGFINLYGDLAMIHDRSKQQHFIEEVLKPHIESIYKPNIDDWNGIKNGRDLALICSLATYLKRCDIKKCGNIPLDKIPKFFDKEQRRFMAKLQRPNPVKKIKDHLFYEHQFTSATLCQLCNRPLWGINYQGYCCQYCQQAFHRECTVSAEKCSKDRKNALSTKLKKPPNRNPPSPSHADSIHERREGSLANDVYEPLYDNSDATIGGLMLPDKASQDYKNATNLGRCYSERLRPHERPVQSKNRSTSVLQLNNPQLGDRTVDEFLNQPPDDNQDPNSKTTTSDLIVNTISQESILAAGSGTDGDSDLDADVNTLPNLKDDIIPDSAFKHLKAKEIKLQITINELIHTERTHLKSLKIMRKCFKEPMERFPGMSPVELDCIFRNLDQLIELHTQFKIALRQHREQAEYHIVREIGDLVLKFLDGEKGDQFAKACAYFIEDQSQALKLIKKKEQSPDFAALMRNCESNPLCRRLTLKDYLPSIMTRFTKYKMLFESMLKFCDDSIENVKLTKCAECAGNILRHMNTARLKKEQELLLKQIKQNLDVQVPSIDAAHLYSCLEVTNNRLIHSGTLKLLPDDKLQKTEFECCLFDDIFVFFQKIPITSEQRGIEESYRYVLKEHQRDATNGRHTRPKQGGRFQQNFFLTPIIRLDHLLIKKKACGGARSFYVIDTDKKQLIEVEANSKDDLEKWIERIEKARKPFEKQKLLSGNEKSLQAATTSLTTRPVIVEESLQLVEPNQVKSEQLTLIEDNPSSLINVITEKDKDIKRLLKEKEMLLARLLNIREEQISDSSPGYVASIYSKIGTGGDCIDALACASSYHNQLIQMINNTQTKTATEKKLSSISTQSLWTLVTQLGEQLALAMKSARSVQQSSNRNNKLLRELRLQNVEMGESNDDLNEPDLRRNSSSSSVVTVTPSISDISRSNPTFDLNESISMTSVHSSESLGYGSESHLSTASQQQHQQEQSNTKSFSNTIVNSRPLSFPNSQPHSAGLVALTSTVLSSPQQASSITDLDEAMKTPSHPSVSLNSNARQLHVATVVEEKWGLDDELENENNTENDDIESDDNDSETDEIIEYPSAVAQKQQQQQIIRSNSNNTLSTSMEAQTAHLDLEDDDEIYDNVHNSKKSDNEDEDDSRTLKHSSEA
ncbi:unnamed protein product, partial [Didymodactylos carnosus]